MWHNYSTETQCNHDTGELRFSSVQCETLETIPCSGSKQRQRQWVQQKDRVTERDTDRQKQMGNQTENKWILTSCQPHGVTSGQKTDRQTNQQGAKWLTQKTLLGRLGPKQKVKLLSKQYRGDWATSRGLRWLMVWGRLVSKQWVKTAKYYSVGKTAFKREGQNSIWCRGTGLSTEGQKHMV